MALKQERIDDLEKLLAAFPFSLLQDFITFTRHCKLHRIDAGEVDDFVRHFVGDVARRKIRQSREVTEAMLEKAPRCTVCGSVLTLEDVNNRKSRMIDDHSKSWWICPDMLCEMDPITTDKYAYEIFIDMGIQVHRPTNQTSTAKRQKAAIQQRSGQGRMKK